MRRIQILFRGHQEDKGFRTHKDDMYKKEKIIGSHKDEDTEDIEDIKIIETQKGFYIIIYFYSIV